MNNYVLSAESTVDLPYARLSERNVPILFYTYSVGTQIFEDDMGRTKGERDEFYAMLAKGAKPVTSQINVAEYVDFFKKQLDAGKDVLHVAFGSGMSGSVNNAFEAAKELEAEYSDRKVVVVDSLCSSGGYGMLVEYALDMRDAGSSLEEVAAWLDVNRNNIHHRFFCTDLTFFRRSGRVTALTSLIGTIFGVCPLMKLDVNGKIIAYGKIRGKRKAIDDTVSVMESKALGGTKYNGKCFIHHSASLETAELLKNRLEETFPALKGKIEIFDIGAVVSSHCGPGVTAVFFMGCPRD